MIRKVPAVGDGKMPNPRRTTNITHREYVEYFSSWTGVIFRRSNNVIRVRRKRARNYFFAGMLSNVPRKRFPSPVKGGPSSSTVIGTEPPIGADTFQYEWFNLTDAATVEQYNAANQYDAVYMSRRLQKRMTTTFIDRLCEEIGRF